MASTKELKGRINSAREIQKITNAMHLIASTKLRRAKANLESARPFFDALCQESSRIFQAAGVESNPYLLPEEGGVSHDRPWACLIITSDKGMVGAYNKNVMREAQQMLERRPKGHLFIYGQYGIRHFHHPGVEPEATFVHTSPRPPMGLARKIGDTLVDGYERGDWEEIFVIYTDMKNSLQVETRTARILPFDRPDHDDITQEFEFVPSVGEVLTRVVRNYAAGFIFGALVDSQCSEQNARMTAMDTATQNAQRLLDDLSLEHNRLRQALITQEITEISAGARALKNAGGKEGTPL